MACPQEFAAIYAPAAQNGQHPGIDSGSGPAAAAAAAAADEPSGADDSDESTGPAKPAEDAASAEALRFGNSAPGCLRSSRAPASRHPRATVASLTAALEESVSLLAAEVDTTFQPLRLLVSEALGEEAALDRAFVKDAPADEEGREEGMPAEVVATSEDSGIDYDAAMAGFAMIKDAGGMQVGDAGAMASFLALRAMKPRAEELGVAHPHTLRRLVVILLSPFVGLTLDTEMLGLPEGKTKPLTLALDVVSSLHSEARATLVRWFSRMPAGALEAIITPSLAVFDELHSRSLTVDEVRGPSELLAIAHEANEACFRREMRRILPFERFYSSVLSDEIRPEDEYKRHILSQRGKGSFSFLMYPFLLSAAAKTELLALEARSTMIERIRHSESLAQSRTAAERAAAAHTSDDLASPFFVLEVRRDAIVEDTLRRIVNASPKWQLLKPLRVKFAGEAGIDEGGVRKEFFQVITRQLFTVDYGMFREEPETNTLWFNHDSVESRVQWELLGSLLGMAIHNSIILDVQFPTVVYRRLLGQPVTLRDLAEFRPSVAKSLSALLDYEADDIEDVMALDFTASYDSWGASKTHELVPDGAKRPVTQANKAEYVQRYVTWALEELISEQFEPFRKGFANVVSGKVPKMFQAEEMELLVTGSKDLDFAKLKSAARYEEPYDADHQVIKWFWEAVQDELSAEEQRKLLAFATGSARAPIRGLGSVRLTISRAGPDSEFLPSAHTCFSHMLLPEYESKDKLVAKLRSAILESEGFGLM
ncbi:hypothetical protein FNF29_04205 [Cafeteria roenbergensis]|uniref:HECT-type E3 ubiquitin transferase n=1 Tax=Cafeteria roenbergensis TaxID=33653 RepID=A0A5A8CJP6_CAFRO|nr:hypothetical protein FNF29_04205 [Cafeteria roenbergensis]|eukprot:KAA0152091.1 hypothetical protein FNF29_04205 [Cafeteria roenbergensis]